MSTILRKDDIHRLVDQLPDGATIDDLIQKLYVVECIEQGLKAASQGRVTDVMEVRRKYGLPS